ncbi:hypothetical protein SSX86_012831 [Deinandra increscens subsp. villosa]|uniref:Replication protein A 70 kDa DNA-binding subunit B/D first OB fold domain-containing protein n=1 Tax=Deinandra increscens subsp. villosa TaxID=3103831 RepID=A0AAP0H109_9ASTR
MYTSSKALLCASKSKLMDTSNLSMLNQLQSVRGRCTIKVRVIRVWKQSFRNNPKETFTLEMILMDEEGNKVQASVLVKWGITLNITLWELYAEQKNDFIKAHPDQTNLVIILQFGLFKFYDGRPYVSNGFNSTRLLINEEIDEISTFKKQYANKGQGSSGYHVTKSISLQDDFLEEKRFMHIAELDEVDEVGLVILS